MARENVKKVVIEGKARTSAIRKSLKDIQRGTNAAGKSAESAARRYEGLSGKLRQTQREVASARKTFDNLNRVLGMAGVAGTAIAVVKGFDGLMKSAARSQGVMKNLRISLEGARNATKGWISDLDLALQANRATDLGIVKTSKEFEGLSKAAFAASRRLGVDAADAMETLTSAIANQSKPRLDNLGVIIDEEAAREELAKSLGKEVKALTELEKNQAFQIAVSKELNAAVARTDTEVTGLIDGWMKLSAEMDNFAQITVPQAIDSLGAMEDMAIRAKKAVIDARIAAGDTAGIEAEVKARKEELFRKEREKAEREAAEIAKAQMGAADIADINDSVIQMRINTRKNKKKGKKNRDVTSRVEKPKAANFFFQDNELFRREIQARELEELQAHELAKAEILLNERTRSLENMQAAGVDPLFLIDAEEQARIALLEKQMEFADTEMEKMQIRDEMRQTHHEAELRRLEEQAKAEKAKLAHTQAVLGATATTFSTVGGIIQSTADMGIVSQRKAAGAMAVAKATENAVIGILETSKAAAAAASYNIPQAILHGAAAATAFAGVGLSMAEAAKMGASGGGPSGRPGMGSGVGPALPPQGGASSGGPGDRPTIPGSGPPAPPSGASKPSGGGGTVNVNIQGFVASTKEELGLEVRKALKASEQQFGGVAV